MSRIVCIDFDGVIHGYDSGWKGIDVIHDDPVEGAIVKLKEMIADRRVEPQIYSSRSKDPKGVEAMKQYLLDHGITVEELSKLPFPLQKPPAFLTIDDRAMCFTGKFPSVQEIVDFKPWNKK